MPGAKIKTMLLRRLGNKAKLLPNLLPMFPAHNTYCEPFFGTGAVFFGKPRAKYNYLNDMDNDVYNLFQVVTFKHAQLYDIIEKMPYHKSLWNFLKVQKLSPNADIIPQDIWQAARFCVLSNYGYMGQPDSLRISIDNTKSHLLKNIIETYKILCKGVVKFGNDDFESFIKQLALQEDKNKDEIFWYCDPPYVGTDSNYENTPEFTIQDHARLQSTLIATGCKFAISEFDHPAIMELTKSNNLNIHILGERKNMKNRRTEILITNYLPHPKLF